MSATSPETVATLPASPRAELPLSSIKVLWLQPDVLSLWGIPYDMRPGQSPYDLWKSTGSFAPASGLTLGRRILTPGPRDGWIWLGTLGWFGSMSAERMAEVRAFRAKHAADLPRWHNEWYRLPEPAGVVVL